MIPNTERRARLPLVILRWVPDVVTDAGRLVNP